MMATGAPNAQSFEEGAKEPEPWHKDLWQLFVQL